MPRKKPGIFNGRRGRREVLDEGDVLTGTAGPVEESNNAADGTGGTRSRPQDGGQGVAQAEAEGDGEAERVVVEEEAGGSRSRAQVTPAEPEEPVAQEADDGEAEEEEAEALEEVEPARPARSRLPEFPASDGALESPEEGVEQGKPRRSNRVSKKRKQPARAKPAVVSHGYAHALHRKRGW